MSKKNLIIQSDMLSGRYQQSTSKILKNVIDNMREDDVKKVANRDKLILGLGEVWYQKNVGNKNKRGTYTSGRMRLSAKLLMEMNAIRKAKLKDEPGSSNQIDELSMWDYLTPENFDLITDAVLMVARPEDEDKEDLKAPSNAIKLGYDIIRMINIKLGLALRQSMDRAIVNSCYDLLKLFENEWSDKVKRKASSVLTNRSLANSGNKVPSPEDVKKLTDHLSGALKGLDFKTDSGHDFSRICCLLQARLLLYNKRRSGEIDSISLENYEKRSNKMSSIDQSMSFDLSELEKKLLQTQELIMVRGKRSRPVPVIVPNDCVDSLKYIAKKEVREKAGIQSNNGYLFPSKGNHAIRSYDSLKKICSEVELDNPEIITSVSMRKYTATLSQVWNLSDSELEWLCNHLGHTKKVHLNTYRQTSGYIERINIGKLLMMEDNNKMEVYKGKSLKDVKFEEIINNSDSDIHVQEDPYEMHVTTQKKKSIKKVTRVKWTAKEEEEIKKYFGGHLQSKTTPKQKEVLKAIEKSRKSCGQINRRNYHTIIKKISNMNKKKD